MNGDPAMLHFMHWAPRVVWLLFVAAFGACVGSLINVLAYRLPRGINVVWPPSRCPSCGTRLWWRDNIPVFGWLALRGRCRYCRNPISPEYPLVEAAMALLFAGFYALYFLVPPGASWLGLAWGSVAPEWARNDATVIWPTFVLLLLVLGALAAMTLVDAKTFTIPLSLTWTPAVLAVAVHPLHAAWLGDRPPRSLAPGWEWVIATPGPHAWWWIGASIGGAAGLAVSLGLLATGLIGRSFADYESWEREALAAEQESAPPAPDAPAPLAPGAAPDAPTAPAAPGPPAPPAEEALSTGTPTAAGTTSAPTALAASPPPESSGTASRAPAGPEAAAPHSAQAEPAAEAASAPARPRPAWGAALVTLGVMGVCAAAAGALARHYRFAPGGGALLGLAAGGVLAGLVVRALWPRAAADGGGGATPENPTGLWLQYPHARREMVREMAFLAAPVLLGLAGGYFGERLGAGQAAPLWLLALAGVLMGYLIGGGVVWLFRIGGSLAVGREAMGMGDVHLMAGVGAALGWPDATIAFFLAAFVGLFWTVVRRAWLGRVDRAMPFGPNLAAATVLTLLAKPGIEAGLGMIGGLGRPVQLP